MKILNISVIPKNSACHQLYFTSAERVVMFLCS